MKYTSENFENIYCFSVIDRTSEFNSIIKYSNSKNESSKKYYQRARHSKIKDFLTVSKKISKDLAQTDEKLESLTLIVSQLENENNKKRELNSQWRKQGVVNEGMVGEDGDGRIGGMHVVVDLHKFIKQDINVLNKDIEKLEQYVKKQSSYNKHTTQHSNAIVLSLQGRLVSLSSEFKVFLQSKKDLLTKATETNKSKDNRKNNQGQSYESNHLNKNQTFDQPQNILYQQQQQLLNNPQQQQLLNNPQQPKIDHHQKQNKQFAIQQGYSTQSPRQHNSLNSSFNNNHTNYNNSPYDSHINNGHNNTRQENNNGFQHYNNSNQNTQNQPYNNSNLNHHHYNNTNNTDFSTQTTYTSNIPNNNQQQMLRQRRGGDEMVRGVDEVGAIEQTIVELGGVFQQLATMVNEQADVVCRIDSHVDETSVNVEAGHGELLKYLRSISQTRAFMLKVFVVLIILFLLFSYMIR